LASLRLQTQLLDGCLTPRTGGSAIAEGPRDALCQLKSCQLLHSYTKKIIWKGLQLAN